MSVTSPLFMFKCHFAYVKLLILSLNALVQSAGFSLKMQPRLLLLPLMAWLLQLSHHLILSFCHGLTTLPPHLILSSNLLHKIQNFAARLIRLAPCHHHSTPLLEKLHWLHQCSCSPAVSGILPVSISTYWGNQSPKNTACFLFDQY